MKKIENLSKKQRIFLYVIAGIVIILIIIYISTKDTYGNPNEYNMYENQYLVHDEEKNEEDINVKKKL